MEAHWEWCHNCGFDPENKRPGETAVLTSAPVLSGLAPAVVDAAPVGADPATTSARDVLAFDGAPTEATAPVADAPISFDDQAVSGVPSTTVSMFDQTSVDAPPAFDAPLEMPAAAPFDLDAHLGAGPEPGPVPVAETAPLFDPHTLFDAPAPVEPGTFDSSPSFGDGGFDHFDATGADSDAGPGDAFDALRSIAGLDSALDSGPDAWDSMASWSPPPAPAIPVDPGPADGGPAGDPVSRIPKLSARLGRQGRQAGADPGAPVRRRRHRQGVELSAALVRNVALAIVVLIALGGFSLALVRADHESRAGATSTTLDPKAPPPIGQLALAGRSSSTLPGPAISAGWTAFRSPDGTFSVSFPAPPEAREVTESTPEGDVTGRIVEARSGSAAFTVAAYRIPGGATFDPRAAFGATAAVDAGPYEVSPGVVASSFRSPDGETPVRRGFVLAQPNRAYILVAVDASDGDFHPFIRGFQALVS